MLFPSCESGILGGLYDVPETSSDYGFIRTETLTGHGTIYINTSQYTHWVYLDFQNAGGGLREHSFRGIPCRIHGTSRSTGTTPRPTEGLWR